MTNPTREHLAGLVVAQQFFERNGAVYSAKALDDLIEQAKAAPQDEPAAWQWLDTAHYRKYLPANAERCAWRPIYAYPSAPADHIPDATKMVDADLLELLNDCLEFTHTVKWPQRLRDRIRAKLSTLRTQEPTP